MSAGRPFSGLKLLLIGPEPPPAGGMATQTEQLRRLLEADGAAVEFVPTNLPYRPAWVVRIPVVRAAARLLRYVAAVWRACGNARVMHLMANSGWSWHLFSAPAILIARLRRLRVVVNYRGGGADAFLGRQSLLVRPVLACAHLLIVPSGFLESVFRRYGMAASVVPNIIDLDRFSPAPRSLSDLSDRHEPSGKARTDRAVFEAHSGSMQRKNGPIWTAWPTGEVDRPQVRQAPKARHDAPHLVVGRHLEAIYDNATALRAFARLRAGFPNARLTLAGVGPERARLERLASDLGVREAVRLPGQLDRDAMAALYRDADVVLNPSLADNMPNSVLEAMASGAPVVTTRVGGVPWIVRDGETGLLVPPGDDQAMADAASRLCRDPALRDAIVAAALAEVRRYRWSEVAPLLAAAYLGGQRECPGEASEGFQR